MILTGIGLLAVVAVVVEAALGAAWVAVGEETVAGPLDVAASVAAACPGASGAAGALSLTVARIHSNLWNT